MQSVTTPRLRPSRFIEWISLVVSTAPVAPIGWPWATAFHIGDVVRQSELARDHNRDRGESFIDLDPLDRANVPAGALQRLFDRRNRSEPEHAGLDGGNP